jgi:pheromone shutdown protein TraB
LIAGVFVGEEISEEQIEDLKRGDMLHAVVSEFGEELPEIKRVLIDERDEYMVGRLAEVSASQDAPKKILALVGAGHLMGMMASIDSPPDATHLQELDQKPPPRKTGLYIGWAICVLILSMFVVGFKQSPELGGQLVTTWILFNGGLSALGTALALGHPVSIVTAFFAAPMVGFKEVSGAAKNAVTMDTGCPSAKAVPSADKPPLNKIQVVTNCPPSSGDCLKPTTNILRIKTQIAHPI